jgi:hypothetical protein
MVVQIYLATSWKNAHYERVLALLRGHGHTVYDFREKGFLFSQIVPAGSSPETLPYMEQAALLDHPVAVSSFKQDKRGIMESNVLVMLYPCGNDAHVELGYAAGLGLYTIVYLNEGYRVGLMDKLADIFVSSDQQLLEALR